MHDQPELTFATVRHRTKVTKGPGSKAAGIAMAFKLIDAARNAGAPSTHPTSSRSSAPGAASNAASSLNATPYLSTRAADDTPVQSPTASNQPINNAA